MSDFLCTTVLEFADRYEGQVMHRGDREACDKVAKAIPAVAISGDETPISAAVLVVSADEFGDFANGQLWRQKPKEPPQ